MSMGYVSPIRDGKTRRVCVACGGRFWVARASKAKACSKPCRDLAACISDARRLGRKPDPIEVAALVVDCPVSEAKRQIARQFVQARIRAITLRYQAEWDAEDERYGREPDTTRKKRVAMVPTIHPTVRGGLHGDVEEGGQ